MTASIIVARVVPAIHYPSNPASTESPSTTRMARTAKIADPGKFTDGISPKYSVWKSALLRKFAGNADLFPTEATKLGYAASHIYRRSGNGSPGPHL
jgi:hypothetical protein